jgi:Sulfotransferase family
MRNSVGLGQIKQSILESGLTLERSLRKFIKRLPPRLILHNLRWHWNGSDDLKQWTEQRLQPHQDPWLFILGLNNSGTTLLVDLLKSHPEVRWLPNEGQYLTDALPLPRAYDVPRNFSRRMDIFHCTEQTDPTPALRIKFDWSYYYQQRPGILLEKSPPNTLRSRWLQAHFQPSRFLAIIRHPYAVCEGIRRRGGQPIAEAALHWVRSHECLLDDMKHLQHCLCFRYEELCSQPEEHLKLIERFLGLGSPFNRDVLTTPRHIHNIDSTPQLIRNLNLRSLEQLSADDLAQIDRIAGPLMDRLGYEPFRCKGSYSRRACSPCYAAPGKPGGSTYSLTS